MKTIYIEIEEKQDKQSKQIYSTHLWYDLEEKKLKVLHGGSLYFKYDLDKVKMITYTKNVISASYKKINNKEAIFSWIKKYVNIIDINISETTSKSIAIDFEDSDESYVLELVNIEGFRYD